MATDWKLPVISLKTKLTSILLVGTVTIWVLNRR